MIKRLVLFLGAVMGMLCMSLPAQAHGTTADTITKKMLRETPPESYKIDMDMQKNPRDGEYARFFLEDEIQIVKIEIDENNLNYLLQNADQKPSVMTNSVHIGDESIGYAGLKTKGSYTLEHTFTEFGNDRFSFTINFGKYVKEEKYGENQNFYGCKKISFNNFFFDKSMMREFFSLKLLSEMGLPTPQYGIAKLYINDAYYGVYFMVEGLDQALVAKHQQIKRKEVGEYITKPENTDLAYDERLDRFCREDGSFDLSEVLKQDKNGVYHATGILKDSSYLWEEDEETLQDVAQPLPTVLAWQKKLNQLAGGKAFDGTELDVNSGTYIELLNEIMDVDEVVRYFATHSFLVQMDDMFVEQHNYGLYVDDNGKAMILPWDYDLSFGCYYPSTSELTANFDIDMMYKGGDERFFGATSLSAEEIYVQFPLFYVIYQNTSLMEKYHSYMRECSKIAALGGTTTMGKSYEPVWFNSYIEKMQPALLEAASEQLAENVNYLNRTRQPEDLMRALPNLAKIIAMRSVGVLSQTDKMDVTVSGEGCDLSTLGNAVMGENARGGKLAAVDAATGIFVTADYGAEKWSNLPPVLNVKEIEKEEEIYQRIMKKTDCEESELTVYAMSNPAAPESGYRLYIPLGDSKGKKVSLYSYETESETATELSVTVDDALYSADTDSIQYIAVVQETAGEGGNTKILWIAVGVMAVLALAGAGVWLIRSSNA